MPYAAIDDNTVIALSCIKEEVSQYNHSEIIEITDSLYRAIMYGIKPLSSIINIDTPATDLIDYNLIPITQLNTYPCMMTPVDKYAIISLAKLLPENSIAVEIGSRIGGSAKLILDFALSSIHLFCIDIEWLSQDSTNSIISDPAMASLRNLHPEILDFKSTFDYATHLLKNYKNVTLLPGASPYDLTEWKGNVDFVFEDSGHENPQLKDNLDFWWGKLQPGGIMAGHDYSINWPDVVQEVGRLASVNGCKLNTYGTVWWMIK